MSAAIPVRLLAEHTANIRAMLVGGARSVLPFKLQPSHDPISRRLPAPSAALVSAFNDWTDSAASGYLPPALVSGQVALSVVSELTARCPYPLLGVLNQGVRLVINQPIAVGEKLLLNGQLVDASDDGYRARIHSHVEIGTAMHPAAIELDAYAAVVLRKRSDGGERTRSEPVWRTVGEWQAAADEGVKFFLLTGDFNPIHTLPVFARRTRFKGCIMHGYGAFAQVFSTLDKAGLTPRDIDVRFVRPLPLPSPLLLIQIGEEADAEGRHAVRLVDTQDQVYQVGSFLPQGH